MYIEGGGKGYKREKHKFHGRECNLDKRLFNYCYKRSTNKTKSIKKISSKGFQIYILGEGKEGKTESSEEGKLYDWSFIYC